MPNKITTEINLVYNFTQLIITEKVTNTGPKLRVEKNPERNRKKYCLIAIAKSLPNTIFSGQQVNSPDSMIQPPSLFRPRHSNLFWPCKSRKMTGPDKWTWQDGDLFLEPEPRSESLPESCLGKSWRIFGRPSCKLKSATKVGTYHDQQILAG